MYFFLHSANFQVQLHESRRSTYPVSSRESAFTAISPRQPRRRPRVQPRSPPNIQKRHVMPCACVPRDVESALSLCVGSVDRAAGSGLLRLRLNVLIPGLNPLIEEQYPYNEPMLTRVAFTLARRSEVLKSSSQVSLLFKSAGTAASASASMRADMTVPENVRIASYYGRDDSEGRVAKADGWNIIVNPVDARGNPVILDVMDLVEQAPSSGWILVNPVFGGDRSALGIAEIERREQFLRGFVDTFYFRNLFVIKRPKLIAVEKGALTYEYPGPWVVSALHQGRYVKVRSFETSPAPNEISTTLENAAVVKQSESEAFARKNSEEKVMDTQFLKLLVWLAVFASAVFWALRVQSGGPV